MSLYENINPTTVNDYHWSITFLLLRIINLYLFTRFINDTNKFECNLILKVNCEVSQEKNWFFDDSHIRFKNKLLLKIRLNVIKKLLFFRCFEWNAFELVFFLFDVMFHFMAEFSGKLIMVSKFVNGLLIVVKFLIFLFYLIKSNSDNVDHVTKDCSSKELDEHDENDFNVILRGKITITNSNHRCDCPIETINVLNVPFMFFQTMLLNPCSVLIWLQISGDI